MAGVLVYQGAVAELNTELLSSIHHTRLLSVATAIIKCDDVDILG